MRHNQNYITISMTTEIVCVPDRSWLSMLVIMIYLLSHTFKLFVFSIFWTSRYLMVYNLVRTTRFWNNIKKT